MTNYCVIFVPFALFKEDPSLIILIDEIIGTRILSIILEIYVLVKRLNPKPECRSLLDLISKSSNLDLSVCVCLKQM